MSPRILLPALLPLVLAPLADEVTFHAAEGTTLVRTFTAESELELDDMSVTLNGDDHTFGEPELSASSESTLVVRDVYGPPDEGRPQHLTRTFETLEGSEEQTSTMPGGEGGTEEMTSSSALEGRQVTFTWDDDEEGFLASFADDGEEDEELLEGLAEDMDLRACLPEGEVEEGDSWEIDADAFLLIHAPGGVDLEEDGGDDETEDELDTLLDENLDGDFTGTYRGTREEDGRQVAVIELTLELETSADQTVDREGSEVLSTLSLAFDHEGELLWDLEGGHLHSLELTGAVDWRREEQSIFTGPGGEEYEVVQTMMMSGELRIAVAVERE